MAWTKFVNTALDVNGTTPLAVGLALSTSTGDLCYAFVQTANGDVVTGPSGWTKIAEADAGVGNGLFQLWRFVETTNHLSFSWSSAGGFLSCITLYNLSGGDTVTPEDLAATTNVQASTAAPVATGVTTITDGAYVLVGHSSSGVAQNVTQDASLATDSNLLATGVPDSNGCGSVVKTPAGATGNKTGSWATAVPAASILVALRPAGGTPANPPRPRITMVAVGHAATY